MHGEEGNIAGLLLFYFSGVYQSMAIAQQSNGNTFESSLDVHSPALKRYCTSRQLIKNDILIVTFLSASCSYAVAVEVYHFMTLMCSYMEYMSIYQSWRALSSSSDTLYTLIARNVSTLKAKSMQPMKISDCKMYVAILL